MREAKRQAKGQNFFLVFVVCFYVMFTVCLGTISTLFAIDIVSRVLKDFQENWNMVDYDPTILTPKTRFL